MSGTDATCCKVCGGQFSTKRVIIEGEQYHERCALMSYPSHTHKDYTQLSNQMAGVVLALENARRDILLLRPRSDTGSKRARHIQAAAERIAQAITVVSPNHVLGTPSRE